MPTETKKQFQEKTDAYMKGNINMVSGTQTIGQYKIMKWVQENFFDGSVEVKFTGKCSATIYDKTGDSMNVCYTAAQGVHESEE